MNRQRMLLTILVVLLLAAVVYAYLAMPRQKSVANLKFTQGAPAPKPGGDSPKTDQNKLHLELLEGNAGSFIGFKRNIFYLPPLQSKLATLPPPPPPQSLPSPSSPPAPPVESPPSEESLAKAEMAKFNFLGFVKKGNKKTMFISKDNEIFLVAQGDKITNRFEVSSINDEYMTIKSIPDGAQTIIPLMENMPLLTKRR